MTVPGAECTEPVTKEKIAEYTIRTLERTVPSAVPGITFLSGGLSGGGGLHLPKLYERETT